MLSKFLSRFTGGWVAQPQLPLDLPPMTTQPVSSSPSSSSFTHDSSWTYEVFLSFRGEDTRTNFTDHLYKALCDKGIYTFIDRELVRGEEISPALVKAIEESRISLIVFSENYASSRWCLDELVKILQCKQSKQQIVLPIFYKVDPSDVGNQTNRFGDAFKGLIQRKFKNDKEKVLIWREALKKAAKLSGYPFKDGEYETAFISNIVDGILSQVLSRTYLNVPKYSVGIQSHVQDVEMLLDVGGNGRHMVGIWGTSGIGKTTIAKAICNAVAYKFEGSCFLPNVREGSLIQLQKILLQEILGGKKLKIASADKGISIIHERLRHKRILLILDDVNQLEQLENLAGVGWFGDGSRVIITTQDSGLLKCHGIELIYEVQKLFGYQALQLFSLNAFGINEPPNDYLELAKRAIDCAQGLPLAITLLGSHLRNKGIHRWQNILHSYEGQPYTGIQKILQKSYDALDNSVQQVFLDIACFFKGEKKDYVLQIVSNSKNRVSQDCIEVLIEKAMITIDYGRIQMHDLLEKLGKDIVHEECPNDPGERSRLWSPEDVKRVLTVENSETRKIKGIMLKFSKPDEIRLHSKCFVGMINLEIFINRNVFLFGDVEYLPNELRLIDWGGYRCQLQSLPSEFHQVHLADFNMPSGCIKRLGKFENMLKLTSMDLSGCEFLEKIPDLSGIPNIKYLNLSQCTSLVEVDDSVGCLDKLVHLNLERCVRLTRFATRLRLKSLEALDLRDCKRLESFPKIEVEMESLWRLYMNGSGIRELPSSIAYLTGLRKLDLRGCFNLTRFATLRLKSLEELDLRDCKRLESFPKIEVEMESLRRLYMNGSGIRELPSSIAYLTGLRKLDLRGCFNLTRFATLRLKSLEELDLRDCKRLESFPKIEVEMESLRRLYMNGSGIRELPSSIAYLTGLRKLDLCGCFNLTRFATLRLKSLEELDLRDCKRLESFPDIEVEMESLWRLNMEESGIRELPPSIAYLTGLRELNLRRCLNLTRFATLRLKSLENLDLRDCKRLESFPEIEVEMESLRRLYMRGSGIKELPPSVAYLTGLRELNLHGCFNLTRIATLRLKSLEELDLRTCERLERFPEIEVEKESLRGFYRCGSGIRELPPSITYLTGLRVLDLRGCFNLTRYETTFINKIVDGILSQVLRHTYWNVAKHPVGIQSHVQDVKKLLDVGGNGRRMVGIWGTSGIGKTTIAKAIWNAIAHEFEGSCFLPNVREGSLVQLQETLLDKIVGKNLKIGNVDEGIGVIKERLRHKKILLILDDVDQLEQLENLAGDDWFGEGSRVIIITKDRGFLDNRAIELIYEMKKLDYNQALELFSWHAFGRSEPPKEYLELAQRAIAFADGLPLALKIVGSHLCGIDIRRWQVILDGYKGEPYTHIERILLKSFHALDVYAKNVFLDIACFFNGENKDYVLQIVPKNCIEVLVDKAMITIEWDDRILMHDLLANLGKDIVHKESPDCPGQRSRLWFYEDVKQVLTESTGTRNIKGIMVKLPELAEITLYPECFSKMVNLEIFINRNASLCGHINYLPNTLRFIDWGRCQLQSLPPNFQGNRLLVFNMPRSHIRQLEGFKHLPNLTSMNLRGCQFLKKIPNLSGIPNIKYLILSDCRHLVEIDDSVGLLDKLVVLYLDECVKLRRFGTRLRLKSLETLILWGCKRLESFPEIEVEMESLRELYMQQSGIRELPLSIAYLTELRHLDLAGCFNLTRFPTLRLKSLEVLDLKDCKRLESFPELQLLSTNSNLSFPLPNPLYCWSTLRELNLSGTNFVMLPECISKFLSLEVLYLRDCESLLEIPQEVLPPRVGRVFLDNCTSLEKFPKLPLSSEVEDKKLSLINCVRLRGYDITENIFLDQVSSPHSQFQITLPGDEVPKWFSCCKDVTLVERSFGCNGRCEVCFEIPPNLDWETLRLVLCVVNKGNAYVHLGGAETRVHINRKMVQSIFVEATETHVALNCISLLNRSELGGGEELTRLQQGNMCQIIFEFYRMPTPVKILCGVHLLGHQVADHGPTQWLPDAMAADDDIHDDQHQDNELLSLPSALETSLGKRPRLSDFMALDDDYFSMELDDIHDDQHQDNDELLSLPSASETSLGKRPRLSDFMPLDDDHRANIVDVGDHEAQRGEADHPKRRHNDLNEEPKQ